MKMLANNDAISPHPNFDSAINDAICRSSNKEGVSLDDLPVGAVIEAKTKRHAYQIEKCAGGKISISGHPEYCPEPTLVTFHGSTWGTPMIKMRYIVPGMSMEFQHPTLGAIRTTRVQEIHQWSPPHAE